MFNEEEKKLEKWKEAIEETKIEPDKLEQAVMKGFQRAQNTKQVKRRPYVKRGVWSAIVAAILLITLVTSIRVSPAFASAVASIPGMEGIVALIQDNKGLQSAINNEHYQEIGVVGESSGVTVVVDGIIADEMNIVLFYTIEYSQNHRSDFIERIQIKGANEEELKWGSISPNYADDYETSMVSTNSLEISFQEPLSTKDIVVEFEIIGGYGETEIIKLPFTIEMDDAESQRFTLNEEIVVEGQSMTIVDIVIGPVRTAIQVQFNPDNTKEIYGFEDLQIVDEKGEVWSSIENGVTASANDYEPDVVTYYLQSNYFEEAQKLFLQFNKMMAMDKSEAYILVDTEKQEILKQPKDARFSNISVIDNEMRMDFQDEKDFYSFPLMLDFIDNDDQLFEISSWSHGRNEELESTIMLELPKEKYKNPIRFEIMGYPSYIQKSVEVKIK